MPEIADERVGLLEAKDEAIAQDAIVSEFKQSGDYAGMVAHRLSENAYDIPINASIFGFETLPLILIGMALYRFGFFSGGLNVRKMRLWGWAGLTVGAGLSLLLALWVKGIGFTYYGTLAAFMGLSMFPRILMALGIAALLVVYAPKATGWLGQRVSAAGRAAFTNYLGTSIIMLFVFHGWALGLYGELDRPQLYSVMALVWVLILAWSKPWLERFRYGPLEWLWRCLTYGKWFANRR